MDFAFVNLTIPDDAISKDTRRRVRSQAMLSFRHRQRHQQVSDNSPEQSRKPKVKTMRQILPKEGVSGSHVANVEGVTQSHGDQAHPARSQYWHEQMSSYPISSMERYTFTLFHHCKDTIMNPVQVKRPEDSCLPNLHPLNPTSDGAAIANGFLPLGNFSATSPLRTQVLPLTNRDTALFHVILAHAGMDMMTWRGEQFFDPLTNSHERGRTLGTAFCEMHKLEAIRIINDRLNDPVLATSDETILVVSHLACYEMLASATERSQERFREFKIHVDGIEQMLKMRGGLTAIGLETCIAQIALRVDHLYSALTEEEPRFAIDTFIERDAISSYVTADMEGHAFSGIRCYTLLTVLSQLLEASDFLENLQDPIDETAFFSFGIKRALIEDDLFRITAKRKSSLIPLTPMEDCCRVAALLYVQTTLSKVNCKVYKVLVVELRHRMERIGIETLYRMNANLVLWMLLVGGGAAPYSQDRIWYIENLRNVLHTALWEEVCDRLQGWPWRPTYCVPWRATWREAVKELKELKEQYSIEESSCDIGE